MNKLEATLLKRAKKIVFDYFTQELEKQKSDLEKLKDEEFFIDVFNSGILLDINKLKKHGLNHLEKQLKKREI